MADVLFVAVVVAFFALAAVFVVACDRIIGPDELPEPVERGAVGADAEVTV
jgi:hypothetical protein